jgi:hypothetical protein
VSPPGKRNGPPEGAASKYIDAAADNKQETMSTDGTTTAAIKSAGNGAGGRVVSERKRLPPPDPRRPGFIPHEVASAFGSAASAAELVRVGLWTRVPGGYQIVDYERELMRFQIAVAVRGGHR